TCPRRHSSDDVRTVRDVLEDRRGRRPTRGGRRSERCTRPARHPAPTFVDRRRGTCVAPRHGTRVPTIFSSDGLATERGARSNGAVAPKLVVVVVVSVLGLSSCADIVLDVRDKLEDLEDTGAGATGGEACEPTRSDTEESEAPCPEGFEC